MRTRRLARAVPVGLLALTLLAACGDDTSDDVPSKSAQDPEGAGATKLTSRTLGGIPLDVDQATTALLAAGNLTGFDALGPQTSEEGFVSDGKSGCESEDSFQDRFDRGGLAATRVDTGYVYGDDARLLIVTSLVTSFANEDVAASAFDEALADYGSCTHYEDTGEAGDTTVVDVVNNTDTVSDDVDDELNLLGTGLWSQPDYSDVHMGFGLSLARVDGNVTLTQVISLGVEEDNALLAPYTEIAVDRLVAVANGETPEDVAGPTPTAMPASHLAVPPNPSTYQDYFATDPRFSLTS